MSYLYSFFGPCVAMPRCMEYAPTPPPCYDTLPFATQPSSHPPSSLFPSCPLLHPALLVQSLVPPTLLPPSLLICPFFYSGPKVLLHRLIFSTF